MGFKKGSSANQQPLRTKKETSASLHNRVEPKNTVGPNPDKTAKVLDHTKVGIQTSTPDGTWSKADLDKRLQGHAAAFEKATAGARTSSLSGTESPSTTASPYPTKNNPSKYGFSSGGKN